MNPEPDPVESLFALKGYAGWVRSVAFSQRGRRGDVLEWLRTVPAMRPSRKQEAIREVETRPESPQPPGSK